MKKILPLILLTIVSYSSFAEDAKCEQSIFLNSESKEIVQRGCCSHHAGVCSCSGGRQVCCDGTLSPSCLCRGDDFIKFLQEDKESEVNRPNT